MPTFKYSARDSRGILIEASVDADSRTLALAVIGEKGLTPIQIDQVGGSMTPTLTPANASITSGGSVRSLPTAEQFLLTEQLAHLLSAGMTLDEALGVLVKRLKQPRLHSVCESLHRALLDGRSFSNALKDFPRIFSPLYVNMVSAGEASGTLSIILRRLVAHLGQIKDLRDRVQQALIYPAVLVVAGIGMIILFMTKMVPQVTGFVAETGGTLPLPTRLLLAANHLFVGYWWTVLVVAGGIFGLSKLIRETSEGRRGWDRALLRIPGYGVITRFRFYAQFARTLGI